MSEEDDFTRRVEAIAAELGINAMCRLMHRDAFVDSEGNEYEPYDEYEARANGRVLCLDANWSSMPSDAIRREVEHAFRGRFR